MADRVTRPSNANAHPGMVDRNPARRSKEEAKAMRQSKAAAKAQTAMERKANLQKLADFERTEKRKARDMDREANNPVKPASQPKARMNKKRPIDVDGGLAKTAKRMQQGTAPGPTFVEHDEETLANAKLDALLNESGTSESEYKEPDGEEEPESEEETYTNADLEDDEPDTSIRIKKGGKKQKKGVLARDEISAAVAAMSDDQSPFVTATDGVGRVGTNVLRTQSKRSTTSSGLIPNWQNVARPIQDPASVIRRNQARASLSPRADSDFELSSHAITNADNTNPSYNYGGFVPENSGQFNYEVEKRVEASEPSKYKSITKIKDTHAAPPARRVIKIHTQVRKITYDDLPKVPADTKDRFKKLVIPLSLEAIGVLKPWETLDNDAIIYIWNIVYDDTVLRIQEGDVTCEHFLVARALIKRVISGWLHKFAETAERALLTEFALQGFTTDKERSVFVDKILGDAANLSDKIWPFLWETVYDDPLNPSVRKEGLFQGRLVARTFLEHVQIVHTINPDHRLQKRPVGALILAIQAVHRALLYSVSGKFVTPSDKKGAEFSRTNWGDYDLEMPHGTKVPVKRATTFLKKINSLKEEQWADIFKAALSFQAIGKQSKKAMEDEGPQLETDTDKDDKLVDPRYDKVPVPNATDSE